MARVDWTQWEGRVVGGHFHLQRYLGGSARSGVFLTEGADGAKAAIKLAPLNSGEAEAWNLRRELAGVLNHPGLLRILQFGPCEMDGESLVFAVMEYADEDLSLVIPSRALAPAEAQEVLRSVTETLAYLHAHGFVHGRLTPANILAVEDRIKISSDRLLRIGEPFDGNPPESGPPEGNHGLSAPSDVWSLGMAMVEMLTQKLPVWDRASGSDPMVPPGIPEPYREIARRCLCFDPRRRCSLEEVRQALDPSAVRIEPQPARSAVPNRRMIWLAAGVFAGVVITGAILNSSRSPAVPVASAPRPTPAPLTPPPPKPTPFASKPAAPAPVQSADRDTVPAAPVPAAATAPSKAPAASAGGEVVDRVLPNVPPEYLATIHGAVRVAVRVHLDSSGAVKEAELASGRGSRYFDRIALEAARHWKFKPAASEGRAADSTKLMRFDFRREGCSVSVASP